MPSRRPAPPRCSSASADRAHRCQPRDRPRPRTDRSDLEKLLRIDQYLPLSPRPPPQIPDMCQEFSCIHSNRRSRTTALLLRSHAHTQMDVMSCDSVGMAIPNDSTATAGRALSGNLCGAHVTPGTHRRRDDLQTAGRALLVICAVHTCDPWLPEPPRYLQSRLRPHATQYQVLIYHILSRPQVQARQPQMRSKEQEPRINNRGEQTSVMSYPHGSA